MTRRLLVILNPTASAGRAPARVTALVDRLRRRHGAGLSLATSQYPGHALELARAAAATCDAVIAAGGDGTVREVASGLLRTGEPQAALGILPLGTGNDVATQTGLSNIEQAVKAVEESQTRALDAIEARWTENGREVTQHALLFAAVGFAAEVLRLTSPRVKRWFGRDLSYTVGFLRALAGIRSPAMELRTDALPRSGRFFHVCAGNSEWAGGGVMRLSPGARMDDGRLEFCVIEALNRLEVLRCFPMLLRGTFPRHPAVSYFPGRELAVDAKPPVKLALDGDVVGLTPATFRVLPGALRLLVRGG